MNAARLWVENRWSNPAWGFGVAFEGETNVWGARRPGFPFPSVSAPTVARWISFMQAHRMERVVCLLPSHALTHYDDLLTSYRAVFGSQQVCWAPINDFQLADERTLIENVLPFLFEADAAQEKTVVHCSGGVGRTGHILAAWLVSARGLSNAEAIAAVRRNGRNAQESRDPRLGALLDRCRRAFQ